MLKQVITRNLNRRQTMALMGAAGVWGLRGLSAPTPASAATPYGCLLAPEQTEGPYWVDEKLNRSDIRIDTSNGSVSAGVPLTLSMTIHEVTSSGCGVLPGAQVDIWHCDAAGIYSDVSANGSVGRKFLRGYQVTDDTGTVRFTTVYPGWYSGRTVHIHFRVRTFSGSQVRDQFTSQLFFDDLLTDTVFTQAPYNTRRARDTRNATDMVLRGSGTSGDRVMLEVAQAAQGYAANIDVGVNVRAVTVSKPAISSNGIVNAAGYQAGIAPGAWVSIFGQNLASAARSLSGSDIVNNAIPTSLGGVSVRIDDQPAYLQYVSPTQINAQAPASNRIGTVPVVVSNAAGTSDAFSTSLQPVLPGLFSSQKYAAAVRADGSVATGVAVRSGEQLQLYGTGFGATSPSVAPGTLVQTAAPVTAPVNVTIGGTAASLSFAGMSAAGLFQFNITVPALSNGDHEVIAEISGVRSPSGILLKIAA